MATSIARVYKGKDEELPVMAGYLSFSLERDLADFTAYSPKFSADYLATFKAQTQEAKELVSPATETIRLRAVTQSLHEAEDALVDPANRIAGYVKLAGSKFPLTMAQFGITYLRKRILARDAEGTMKGLRTVIGNIEANLAVLQEQGLSDALLQSLKDLLAAIEADNQAQYEIMSTRKQLVQNNLGLLNALYGAIMEICLVGKVLYKTNNLQKLQEYTYTELLKRVRLMLKKQETEEAAETSSAK